MLKRLIFASALSLFMAGPAAAAAVTPATTAYPIVTLSGIDYEVTLVRGTWIEVMHQVTSTPWWGDSGDAERTAEVFTNVGLDDADVVQFAWRQNGTEAGLSVFEVAKRWCGWKSCERHNVEPIYYAPTDVELSWRMVYAVAAPVTAVPLPAAGWLFMSALIGLMGKKRLSRRSVH
jgi:hypothetical protein